MPFADNLANRARFPTKIGDYWAAGKPVVSNDVGDIGKMIIRHQLGLVAQYRPHDMAEKIKYLLNHKNLYQKISSNCLKFALHEYNFNTKTMDLLKVYESVTKKA